MTRLYKLIIYSGILAFICLLAAVTAAILHLHEFHEALGITVLTFACIHVGLVVYRNIKLKQAAGKKS